MPTWNTFNEYQNELLATTERVASAISLLCSIFVIGTFLGSRRFRKPVNRLIFYAVLGNVVFNIATLISVSGNFAGARSSLCEFQSFAVQAFLPADAMWSLSMAINVYLTVFRSYEPPALRAREPWYLLINYGCTILLAIIYFFVETPSNGPIYGPAVLWCWISPPWSYMRIATCYSIAWFCMIAACTIYILAARKIYRKRRELQKLQGPLGGSNPAAHAFVDASITSQASHKNESKAQLNGSSSPSPTLKSPGGPFSKEGGSVPTSPLSFKRPGLRPSLAADGRQHSRTHLLTLRAARQRQRAAMARHRAAWNYTKCCILFFASLLVTWVPASINRVYSTAYPNRPNNFGLNYTAGLLLPLMGFWNALIYVYISRGACRAWFFEDVLPVIGVHIESAPRNPSGTDDDGEGLSTLPTSPITNQSALSNPAAVKNGAPASMALSPMSPRVVRHANIMEEVQAESEGPLEPQNEEVAQESRQGIPDEDEQDSLGAGPDYGPKPIIERRRSSNVLGHHHGPGHSALTRTLTGHTVDEGDSEDDQTDTDSLRDERLGHRFVRESALVAPLQVTNPSANRRSARAMHSFTADSDVEALPSATPNDELTSSMMFGPFTASRGSVVGASGLSRHSITTRRPLAPTLSLEIPQQELDIDDALADMSDVELGLTNTHE